MKFKDFEIRPTAFLDGHKDPKKWDVVKWCKRENPERVFDLGLGEYKMSDTYCFSVASLEWNDKESCWEMRDGAEDIVDLLIDHGVTVQKHGYLETVVEVKDNTVCGSGVKIEYKRCSCCKKPSKFWGDAFCGHCGAKLDLPQPPKGE